MSDAASSLCVQRGNENTLELCWPKPASELPVCLLSSIYSVSAVNLFYKCVHYQACKPGGIFLLWSSSRIHQLHTHIYLQIVGKAKMFNCGCHLLE